MAYESGDETGQVQVKPTPAPKTEAAPDFGLPSVKSAAPAAVFHPLAYRGVVADWPIELRERWGRRANDLEEGGLSWRDAETQAFVEVWNFARGHQSPQTTEAAAQLRDVDQT
jgi:hypothetical protein